MNWQDELDKSIRTVDDLTTYVDLKPEERDIIEAVNRHHPMSVTQYYMSLIKWDDPDDPIRKLAIPSRMELDMNGLYDTSGEAENTILKGLQHKYPATALILSTSSCAMYCRFCFRKRLVGMSDQEILSHLHEAVDYIQRKENITNVLISGGDPFMLSNNMIREFLNKLCNIEHLKFIRFGTRVPVTFPSRILHDQFLVHILSDYNKKKKIQITTHFNHPREITKRSTRAVEVLLRSGIPVHNQTVLLKGVNDNVNTMTDLMKGLTSIGVTNYYLFQCRPTMRVKRGFQVPLFEGLRIIEETRNRLDGYAKRFRYIMSHVTGKIEVLGIFEDCFLFKYHEAKSPADNGRIFKKGIDLKAGWIDDL